MTQVGSFHSSTDGSPTYKTSGTSEGSIGILAEEPRETEEVMDD